MRKQLFGIGVLALSLSVLAGAVTVLPSPATAAVDAPLRINAGGGEVTDSAGDSWLGDGAYSSSRGWGYVDSDSVGGWGSHGLDVAGTEDDEIYSTERWGMDAYRVDLEDGVYHVELLFAETFQGISGDGQRVFDVTVQDEIVIEGLDVHAEVGFASALSREIRDVEVSGGQLEIGFSAREEQPAIKGIIITPAETEQEPDVAPEPQATPTPDSGGEGDASEASSRQSVPAQANVPLYVNVGGDAFQDRQGIDWLSDQEYSEDTGWGYVDGDIADFRYEYHGGTGHFPHSSGREGMTAYRFNVPDLPDGGYYAVTLDFSGRLDDIEGHGERVFYVRVGETVPGVQSAEVLGPIDPWTAFHSSYAPSRYSVEYIRPVDGVV
ncbi:MAG: malectin domain-containing carbohydrate-binding protein, partial [Dehalococcoidia bacterium]